jgi:cell division protein FtsI/penicillin-binding protein 2
VAPLLLRQAGASGLSFQLPGITSAGGSGDDAEELSKVKSVGFSKNVTPPPLTGVDLPHMTAGEEAFTAPAHGARVAKLTLDVPLQQFAMKVLADAGIPNAGIVMTDTRTGRVLVYAAKTDGTAPRDFNVEANAPAASVFKIVTGSSLVEQAGLSADTRQCYWGGEHKLEAANLVDDKKKDKWCATLAEAMGRSLNTVFARLASKNLDREKLGATAHAYGFGDPLPFDVETQATKVDLPEDPLGFARTAAGFWNTTLSPIAAATLAMTVANRGTMIKPFIVDSVSDEKTMIYRAGQRTVLSRAVKPETAEQVTRMMESTVSDGTSFKAFHDGAGQAYIPGVSVAGKTGTLTKQTTDQFFTWFVGFAPSQKPEVAISVLAVNKATWKTKANTVARMMLQAYFAQHGAAGVQMPR